MAMSEDQLPTQRDRILSHLDNGKGASGAGEPPAYEIKFVKKAAQSPTQSPQDSGDGDELPSSVPAFTDAAADEDGSPSKRQGTDRADAKIAPQPISAVAFKPG